MDPLPKFFTYCHIMSISLGVHMNTWLWNRFTHNAWLTMYIGRNNDARGWKTKPRGTNKQTQ